MKQMTNNGNGIDSLKAFLKDNPSYDIYDYSQIELADQCLRKYSFRYIHSMAFPEGIEAAFSSKIIHPMIGRIFQQTNALPQPTSKDWLEWLNGYSIAIRNQPITNKQKNIYTIETAKVIYERISTRRYGNFVDIDPKCTKPEVLYWRVLPDIKNAVWIAKPDLIIEDPKINWRATVEAKVSTFAPNHELNPFDRQLLSQAWTTQLNLQVRLFNLILLSESNQIQQINCYIQNNIVDAGLLNEWLEEIQFAVMVIQQAKASNVFPKRSPRACMDFGKPCPMAEFCTIGPGRQLLMDTRPKANPFEYLGL